MPHPLRNRLLLAGSQIHYLLLARFTGDIAAPLPASLPVDVGGPLTTVQVDGQLSQSGGKLVFPAQSTPADSDLGFYYAPGFSRVAGRALLATVNKSSGLNWPVVGWRRAAGVNGQTANAAHQINFDTGIVYAQIFGAVINVGAAANGSEHQIAVILRASGAFYLIKGGIYTNWTLLWIEATDTTATVYPTFSNYTGVGTLDNFRVLDLVRIDSRFATDTGLAVVNVPSPANATTYPATADFWGEFTVPFAGAATNFNYRQGDNNNCWRLLINASGDVSLDERVAAVATTRASALATLTSGQTYRIIVVVDGNVHKVYKQLAGTVTLLFTYTDASNLYLTNINLRYSTLQAGATNLIVYPRFPGLPGGA